MNRLRTERTPLSKRRMTRYLPLLTRPEKVSSVITTSRKWRLWCAQQGSPPPSTILSASSTLATLPDGATACAFGQSSGFSLQSAEASFLELRFVGLHNGL